MNKRTVWPDRTRKGELSMNRQIGVKTDRPWSYADARELYREAASIGSAGHYNALHITRIAPGDGFAAADWILFGANPREGASAVRYRLIAEERESGLTVCTTEAKPGLCSAAVTGLTNGVDYVLRVEAYSDSVLMDASPLRLVRTGPVPGTVVNYLHPEDEIYGFSGRSTASPSIARLPGGDLVASHDIYWQKGGQNVSLVFCSSDEGASWSFVTFLYPCFWGKLFVHRGSLYMLGTSTEYGALLIGRSDDGGATWSPPTVLLEAGTREKGGPHKAPMPILEHNGRLWTAIDYGTWTNGIGHDSGVISAPADSDLLDAASWTATPFLPYSSDWPGTVPGKAKGLLEGNMLVAPDGRLINMLRYQTTGDYPEHGRAIYLVADANRPDAPLEFGKVVSFYGNLSKFTIVRESSSGLYWSLVNRVTSDHIHQRNVLSLVRSADLERWELVRDLLDYESNGWPEDSKQVGFQYVDWIMEDDVLLYLSRTAINGAYNYHNANYITFHRMNDFR